MNLKIGQLWRRCGGGEFVKVVDLNGVRIWIKDTETGQVDSMTRSRFMREFESQKLV